MEFLIGVVAASFSAMAFGRPCRVIAERVHADKEAIRNYEFQKSGGHRMGTRQPRISAASFGRETYRSPITSDNDDSDDSDDSDDNAYQHTPGRERPSPSRVK